MAQQISSDRKPHAPPTPLDGLVDEMLAWYVEWRVHAGAVAEAYRQWSSASRAQQASRFSIYLAALDREGATATRYASAVKEVECRLQDG